MIGKYKFEELDFLSHVPATVFYSETDTPRSDMELWKKYFAGAFNILRYEGNHFFIQEHHTEMAEVIMDEMRKE